MVHLPQCTDQSFLPKKKEEKKKNCPMDLASHQYTSDLGSGFQAPCPCDPGLWPDRRDASQQCVGWEAVYFLTQE